MYGYEKPLYVIRLLEGLQRTHQESTMAHVTCLLNGMYRDISRLMIIPLPNVCTLVELESGVHRMRRSYE